MRWTAVVMVAALAASAREARADRPYRIGGQPAWFVSGGATTGGTVATGGRGGYLGGELSLVRVREARFLGVYADGYYDFGVDGTYVTAGPELGWIRRARLLPVGFGVDGGAALRVTDDAAFGATARVFVSLMGTVSICGRYVYLDDDTDDHVVQVGLTLKFPLGSAR